MMGNVLVNKSYYCRASAYFFYLHLPHNSPSEILSLSHQILKFKWVCMIIGVYFFFSENRNHLNVIFSTIFWKICVNWPSTDINI